LTNQKLSILAVGASGSIGAHVIDEAIREGHNVRALARNPGQLKPRPGPTSP
jgi:uncharacterized protein YbjT (DUF2867 family)